METLKTPADILNEAADLLTEEGRWHRCGSFWFVDGSCKMCAHGAIEYCGNRELKERVMLGYWQPVKDWNGDDGLGGDEGERAIVRFAHRLADKVGLTMLANDLPCTTKEQVIDQLRRAAQLAMMEQTSQ